MKLYFQPIVKFGPHRPAQAESLAGGQMWFSQVLVHRRGAPPEPAAVRDIPTDVLAQLTAPRAGIDGLSLDRPRLMGILNTTPDSFSDGGLFLSPKAALSQGQAMAQAGADIIDIGGESTRPGAETVLAETEIARTAPVIKALRTGFEGVISIDTRKAAVAEAAQAAGARMLNDVSALTYDSKMVGLAAHSGLPICLMHAQGTPDVMQKAPVYDDVLLDVYDSLAKRIAFAQSHGVKRAQIIVDPGIGFGKTIDHNLRLLAHISLFHGLGCGVMLGASRKQFIGTLSGAQTPRDRVPGSIAVALAAVAQGVQILRVHDIAETRQALTLWWAATKGTTG